eukprot:4547666-Prymnesium_polylepis.1
MQSVDANGAQQLYCVWPSGHMTARLAVGVAARAQFKIELSSALFDMMEVKITSREENQRRATPHGCVARVGMHSGGQCPPPALAATPCPA